jgi:hypothetical protein
MWDCETLLVTGTFNSVGPRLDVVVNRCEEALWVTS